MECRDLCAASVALIDSPPTLALASRWRSLPKPICCAPANKILLVYAWRLPATRAAHRIEQALASQRDSDSELRQGAGSLKRPSDVYQRSVAAGQLCRVAVSLKQSSDVRQCSVTVGRLGQGAVSLKQSSDAQQCCVAVGRLC